MNKNRTSAVFFAAAILAAGMLISMDLGCGEKAEEKSAVGAAGAKEYANVNCPMMTDNKIDPAKVTKELTRTHKGKDVAFCCPACPPAWDKLSDEEKDGKLAAVAAKPK